MKNHNKQWPWWIRRLVAKTKAAWRAVSQLSKLQKYVINKGVPREYDELYVPGALETAKQLTNQLANLCTAWIDCKTNNIVSTFPNPKQLQPILGYPRCWIQIWLLPY